MGPKKKKVIKPETPKPENAIKIANLKDYSWNKVYHIIFLIPENEESNERLNSLIKTAKQYETMSLVSFISDEEVLNSSIDDLVLPEDSNLVKSLEDLSFVELTKLKLIETFYKNYQTKNNEHIKFNALENNLRMLTKECRKGRKINASEPNQMESDISDLLFDEDIANQVWNYILYGFDNLEVLTSLISSYNVPITAVIKVNLNNEEITEVDDLKKDILSNESFEMSESRIDFQNLSSKLHELFFGLNKNDCLQDTILMKFTSSGNDEKDIFKQFLHVIKAIPDIKLTHLHYIRHIQMYKPQHRYNILPKHCLKIYNRTNENLCENFLTTSFVLNALIEEVESRLADKWVIPKTEDETSRFIKSNCYNPCDMKYIFKRVKLVPERITRSEKSYLFYEGDDLNVAIKLNKRHAPALYNLTKIWKMREIFKEFTFEKCQIDTHKHDINPAEESKVKYLTESDQHFIYLFLLMTLKESEDISKPVVMNKMTEILDCHQQDRTKLIKSYTDSDNNLYKTPIYNYIWAEDLSADVLIQELIRTENNYLYYTKKYCDDLNVYFYTFSNKLDSFGINIQFFSASLQTLPCLRDFCRYITVEQSDWLSKNPPPTNVKHTDSFEVRNNFKDIISLYPEYAMFLYPKSIEASNEDFLKYSEGVMDDNERVPFEQTLQDLIQYPNSSELKKECNSTESSTFTAYDIGNNFISVEGVRTAFVSHDGVQLIVDTTSLVSEEKCTVKLSSDDYCLILHSDMALLHEQYIFHIYFDDKDLNSFITFYLPPYRTIPNGNDHGDEIRQETGFTASMTDGQHQKLGLGNLDNVKVKSFFESEVENGTLPLDNDDDNLEKSFGKLVNSITEANANIFTVRPNLKYLEPLKPLTEVPLKNIITRIVSGYGNISPKDDFMKKYVPVDKTKKNTKDKNDEFVQFRVTLHGDLYVTCYKRNNRDEIMQEHSGFVEKDYAGHKEEFRLFTNEGFILIKMDNGEISIMQSNGDQMFFEKPDEDRMESITKKCHCINLLDYKKRLNKIFKDSSPDLNAYEISKKTYVRNKKGFIHDDMYNILNGNQIPYKKISKLNFQGITTTLSNNIIVRKQNFFCFTEENHATRNLFYDRSDGFKCHIKHTSSYTVLFPDGTKITSTAYMQPQLKDGYVFISLQIIYEHPKYATVEYDIDKNLKLKLNEGAALSKRNDGKILVNINDTSTEIDSEAVEFKKQCKQCKSEYTCNFNLKPFKDKVLNSTDRFLIARDSYNKEFSANYKGDTTTNSDFLREIYNIAKCDHTRKNIYKKVFVVRPNFTGKQFWTEEAVNFKRDTFQGEIKEIPECNGLRFVTNVYRTVPFEPSLTERKLEPEPQVKYSIYRLIRKMIKIANIKKYLINIQIQLESSNFENEKFMANLDEMIDKMNKLVDTDTVAVKSKDEDHTLRCDRLEELKKLMKTAEERIEIWRNYRDKYWNMIRKGVVPKYFQSEFCKIIE